MRRWSDHSSILRVLTPLYAAVVMLVLACTPASVPAAPPTSTVAPVSSPTPVVAMPTPTLTPIDEGPASPSAPEGAVAAQVVRVVDGDTIEVMLNGEERAVRYIGVDTPETKHPTVGVEPFGPEASEFNTSMVEGKTVYLEKDVSETDRYGRLLRYVYVGDEMVNAVLVREGYAQVVTFPPDVKHIDMLRGLEREAREAGRGLWGLEEATPEPSPEATTTPLPPGETCDYSETSEPRIKGNIGSSGEKIYHVPGGSWYERTEIDESDGERWFCTEDEAQAAGWRRAGS